MSFLNPILLLSLLLIPLLAAAYVLLRGRPARYPVRYTNLDVLASVAAGTRSWRRHAGVVLFLLALAALLVGLARPQVNRLADREEATIVLLIDVSGSMTAEDVEPTRLAAAQTAVVSFIRRLPDRFQIGLIGFSEFPDVVTPATDDHEVVIEAVSYLYPQRGTNIGDSIARAVEVVRSAPTVTETGASEQPPAAILLLSDGSQTIGILSPQEGAARAKSFKIPIYAVALGTAEGVVTIERFGVEETIPVPPDPATLREITSSTGGKLYEARSVDDLSEAYEKLGSLVSKVERPQEVTVAFLGAGLLLLLAAGAVGAVTFPRLP